MLGIEILKRFGSNTAGTVVLASAYIFGTDSAKIILDEDGLVYATREFATGPEVDDVWITPQLGMNQFEVRATFMSGHLPPGTFGSWENLGTARSWGWENMTVYKKGVIKLEIRRASGGAIVSTVTITLEELGIHVIEGDE